ncbi:hypothetical protein R3P38DRAFT_3146524, partial [Favolaschia claudopus]
LHQAVLPGASVPMNANNQNNADRCAVCVKQYCDRRFDCPGKGNRKSCKCPHPPLQPGEKVRITEKQIALRKEREREAATQGASGSRS